MNVSISRVNASKADRLKDSFSLFPDIFSAFSIYRLEIADHLFKFTNLICCNFDISSLTDFILFLTQPDLSGTERFFLSDLIAFTSRKCPAIVFPSAQDIVKALPESIFAFKSVEHLLASFQPDRRFVLENPLIDSLPIPSLVYLCRCIVVFKYSISRELLAITELALDTHKEIFVFTAPCWDSQYSGNLMLIREGVTPLTGKSDLELYISS